MSDSATTTYKKMDLNVKLNHKILLAIAGFFILVFLVALFSVLIFYKNKNISAPAAERPIIAEPIGQIQGQDAQAIALVKAKEWRADAVLSYIASEPIIDRGTESWRLIYVSPILELDKTGYEIIIKNKKIFSAQEIYYSGQGEDFPADTKITQAQAVERVKNMSGFEGAEILSVDAVYGAGTKTWYWGIKTTKGVVSVEMK